MQELPRPPAGERCRLGIAVRPIMPAEGMTLTRIAVDRRVRFLSKCRFDLTLRSLGNEFILLGYMHEKGRLKPSQSQLRAAIHWNARTSDPARLV